ncbi:type II toxin-antitoxin system VapC family toxin [Spirosoma sp. KCTC 42546]|uniref:type II toxin-antitoxin system VapC family toxin n=1 Tax=Spirosoma sp. KCTC 42546 TaxID=2520506 RepID=UPI00115AC2E6|nr:type II toxin-antitoxin system VapC family toxin [Spirosoma sp. KCTC 42546]QDK80333.1 type II toxin-antitoxin system VapC family toxin [Spirosoma sp. KCTC 42546]
MILDSNILIYSLEPGYDSLRIYLAQQEELPFISLITKLEVLGFYRLQAKHKIELERFLTTAFVLPITDNIITEAIRLRQQRKRSIGDSIIAATGLIYNQPVLTNNVADFTDVDGLTVISLASVL